MRSVVISSAIRSISRPAMRACGNPDRRSENPPVSAPAPQSRAAARAPAWTVRHARNAGALMREKIFSIVPATARLRPQCCSAGTRTSSRNTSLTSCSPSMVMIGRTVMPGRLHVHQQHGNAILLARLLAGAHQAEHPIRHMRQRSPGLLAVDNPFIAVASSACDVSPSQIRSRGQVRKNPGTTNLPARGCAE